MTGSSFHALTPHNVIPGVLRKVQIPYGKAQDVPKRGASPLPPPSRFKSNQSLENNTLLHKPLLLYLHTQIILLQHVCPLILAPCLLFG